MKIIHNTYSRKWNYAFASKEIEVEEEYIVIDENLLLGTVGGTLGIFIGISFRDIAGVLIGGLKWILKSLIHFKQKTRQRQRQPLEKVKKVKVKEVKVKVKKVNYPKNSQTAS